MPAAVGGRKPPPKRCPICGQRIWDPAVPISLCETWRHYTEHVHAFHPEYESWNRRASFYYVLVAAVFVASLFAVIFAPVGLAPIIFGVGVGVLLIGTTIIFSVKQMVRRRFQKRGSRSIQVRPVRCDPSRMTSGTEKPADRWFQIGGRVLIVAVIIISYFDSRTSLISTLWIPGTVLLAAGLSLNVISRAYLGKFYAESVRIRSDHKLITNGPYRLIRHPIYLSVIFIAFCPPVILGSIYGFVIAFVIIPMLLHRISVEEKFLVSKFGEEYVEYANRTKRLIPYLY